MGRHTGSPLSLLTGVIGILLVCTGCTSTGSAVHLRSTTTTGSHLRPVAPVTTPLPALASVRVVDAYPVVPDGDYSNPLHLGQTVPSDQVSDQVMIGGGTGFGLTGNGYLYPTRTTDGGRSWVIDSPWWFGAPMADAPNFVATIGGATSQVVWAWDAVPKLGLSQVLYTTVDGGLQWWRTFFRGKVTSITQAPTGNLVATVAAESGLTSGPRGTYVSDDGGRSWRYTGAA